MSMRASAVLLAVLLVFSAPVFAQDGDGNTGEMTDDGSSVNVMKPPENPEVMGKDDTAAGANDAGAVDDSMERVPTYEGSEQFPDEIRGTPAETYLRLAQDYLWISEIGGQTPGQVPLWPRGQMKVGPILVFPYLQGRLGYTNNVFDEEDGTSSWFTDVGGGVAATYNFADGRGNIGLGVDYDWRKYLNESDVSYSQWVAGISGTWNFNQGIWVRVGFKYERLVSPVRIDQAGEMKRRNYYPFLDLGFNNVFGNRFTVQMGVNGNAQQFDDQQFENNDNALLNAYIRVGYPILKNTVQLYVRYDYYTSVRGSDDDTDLKGGNQVSLGVDGYIPLTRTQRLTGYIQVGYRRDVYDSQVLLPDGKNTDTNDNAGTPTVVGGIRYLPDARSSAELRLLRTFQFSPSSNYQVKSRADLFYSRNIIRRLVGRCGIYWEYSEPSEGDSLTRIGGGLGLRYLIHENVDLDVALDYQDRITDRPGYENDQFVGSVGATVYFR